MNRCTLLDEPIIHCHSLFSYLTGIYCAAPPIPADMSLFSEKSMIAPHSRTSRIWASILSIRHFSNKVNQFRAPNQRIKKAGISAEIQKF